MAGPQIGFAGKVECGLDASGAPPGSFTVVGGSCKGHITPKLGTADTTVFNTAGYKGTTPTLIDVDLGCELFYEVGDAGQAILLAAVTSRARVWLKVWRDGTRFSQAAGYVNEFPNDIDPANPERVAVKMTFDGATSTAPTFA